MKKINELLVYVSIFLVPFYVFRFKIEDFRTNLFEISIFVTFVIFVFQQVVIAIRQPAEKQSIPIDRYEPTNHIISRDDKSGVKGFKFGGFVPLIFLIIVLISAVQSDNLITGLGILKGWFVLPIMLYYSIVNIFSRKNIYKIAWPAFIALIAVSLWAIFQKFGFITTLFYQKGDPSFSNYLSSDIRAFGPFESPNYLAMYLVPIMFLSLMIFEGIKDRWQKITIGVLYLVPISALFFSDSRAGIIALLSSVLIFIAIYYGDRVKLDKKYLIMVVGLLIVFSVVASIYLSPRQGSDSIRKEIYSYSIQMIRENCFGGIGLGNFQNKIAELSVENFSFREFGLPYALHPHNLFLSFWLNIGILGLLTFLIIIYKFIINLIKSYKNNRFATALLASAMSAILIHGLFDTTYFKNDLSAIFWIIVAFGLAIKRHETYGTK